MTTTITRTAGGTGFLTTVLRLDAAASGALGLLFLAAAPALDGPLGTPVAATRVLGALLIAYAAFVWLVSNRPTPRWTGLVIGLNLFWVLDSAVYVAAEERLTALGVAFGLVQAAAVLGFAALEYAGLRRTGRA